jgi:hypothetical protein
VNHILYVTSELFKCETNFELFVERHVCLRKAKKLHKTNTDLVQVYKCRRYFFQTTEVVSYDLEASVEMPRMIDLYVKNSPISRISEKAVPLIKQLLKTRRLYEQVSEKTISKQVQSLFTGFLRDIMGDDEES